jgi:cell division protein FtsQ
MSERVTLKRGKRPPKSSARRKTRARPARSRRLLAPAVAVGAAGIALFAAWLFNVPERAWLAAARGVAGAGFEVRNVEVTGLHNMARLPVYTTALDGASDSMLLVDLDDIRARLKLLPWIADASVGRELPDTLVIDITERRPAALWQYEGRYALIDEKGAVLTRRGLTRFVGLPVVVGKGANVEAAHLAALMKDYPAVSQHVASAIRVGERRWDLRLKSGETLALPDDYAAARTALDNFVRVDRDTGLIDKGFSRFDMRLAGQLVVRLAAEPDSKTLPTVGTEI